MRVRAIAASALALAGLAVACSRVDDAAQHGTCLCRTPVVTTFDHQ
jgi:hypothetical protein